MKKLNIALAGNANVGKSVIFNYFTRLSQHIGNWPGKTVEKAEGTLIYGNYEIKIIDLPGIYSLQAQSPEETVAREYLREGKPDAIINVVDASVLERNLFLTFQLLKTSVPLIVLLNMADIAKRKGITINRKKLERELGVPVVEGVAIHGKGLENAIQKAIAIKEKGRKTGKPAKLRSAKEIYRKAESVSRKVEVKTSGRMPLDERIDSIALHRIYGYFLLLLVLAAVFYSIFTFGDWLSALFYGFFDWMKIAAEGAFGSEAASGILWNGIVMGIAAGFAVAIPYILPFYIVFSILEDSGYVARMAFLMDGFMHSIGLHGKAFLPLFLGYGCNVPACIGCRIIETERERFQASFLATMVPCAARSIIILGLVGAYLGWHWAAAIYLFNIAVVWILGKATTKFLPGEPTSLIMEMPSYKMPQPKGILKRSFERVKAYITVAFPIIIAMTFLISLMDALGFVKPIEELFSPITVGWLGLPAAVGITLLFGVLRKELALIMLGSIFGTTNFGAFLSPLQMLVFTLVMVFYIPCSATIATLVREFGWKKAAAVTIFEIIFALLLGGIALRLLGLFF
ncbi:hypothetical protein AUJ17_00695 [Candidatus Micrarchaeota archaeon CG1_02_47_40]|nr:MAG: hypothetical protein AUJ17_00695 [Candidatus Micrarchaeota archaeon CG1_02_47_40]